MVRQRRKARWNVERRLEFIDFRLYWDGHVNRGDLVDFFGISVPQASADLSQYHQAAKGNIIYDKYAKTYIAGSRFSPVFFNPSADRYLSQLRLIEAGIITDEEAWVVRLPAFSIVPILRRRLEAETLRRILDAVRTGSALHITYQSFSHPKPKRRWISPHALGFDGFRWHARAWCHIHDDFRDFVLARILKVADSEPSDIDPDSDLGWQREVTLRLAPHPGLQGGKCRVVELDYGMIDGMVEVTMRACLSYYFVRQLGLDRDPAKITPERQQIILVNREEFKAATQEAGDSLRPHR